MSEPTNTKMVQLYWLNAAGSLRQPLGDSTTYLNSQVIAINGVDTLTFFPEGQTDNTTGVAEIQFCPTQDGVFLTDPAAGTVAIVAHSGGVAQGQIATVVPVNGMYCRLKLTSGAQIKMYHFRTKRSGT